MSIMLLITWLKIIIVGVGGLVFLGFVFVESMIRDEDFGTGVDKQIDGLIPWLAFLFLPFYVFFYVLKTSKGNK